MLAFISLQAQNYNFKHLTSENGLPQSVVTDIYKDSRGFVWITTWNGVSRYDGINIRNNEEIAKGYLPVGQMGSIKEDKYGDIWIGSTQALVKYSYAENRFFNYTSKSSSLRYSQMYYPRLLVEDKVMISYDDFYIKIFDSKKETFTEFELSFDVHNIEFIDPINPNLMPFANKLAMYRSVDNISYLFLLKLKGNNLFWKKVKIGHYLNDLVFTYNGGDSLFFLNMPASLGPDANICIGFVDLITNEIKQIKFKENIQSYSEFNDHLYIGTYKDGIIKIDKNTFKEISRIKQNDADANALLNNNIIFLKKIDNELWAVSWGKGINISSLNDEVLSYHFSGTESKKHNVSTFVRGIVQDKNENYWLASHESGIILLDKNLKFKSILNHTASKEYPAIYYSSEHKLFFSNYGLECHDLNTGKTSYVKNEQGYINAKNISFAFFSFANDTYNNLYAANVQTIFQINVNKQWYQPIEFHEPFPAYEYLYITRQNRIFASTISNGICEFEFQEGCYNSVRRLGINLLLRNVYEENDSILWLATTGGLFQYNSKTNKVIRHFTQKDGLPNDVVYALAPDNYGNLWMSTNKGIAKLNIVTKHIKLFTSYQNESSREYNRNSVCRAKDGSILFGSIDGITRVRPWLDNDSKSAVHLHFTAVKSRKEHSPFSHHHKAQTLILEKGTSFIEFNFQVVDLINPKAYSIKYKLHGINEDWVHIDNPGYARFSNLSPDSYQFTIQAYDEKGKAIDETLHYYFTIPPYWYQTLFLKVFAVIAILFSAAYIYYLRVKNKFHKASIEIEKERATIKERERLLADLHDDIGAGLSSIHINSELVEKIQDSKPEVAKRLLSNISRESKEISSKLSDFIWSIKQETNEVVNIKQRILDFQQQLFEEKNINFHFDIDELSIPKDLIFIKNLLLIIKEALNNITKYSEATKVSLTIRKNNNQLELKIIDNGRGFDPSRSRMGNGINNMQKRCETMHGEFNIDSRQGIGTEIRCVWTD